MTTTIMANNHQPMPFNTTISIPDKEIEQMFNLQGTLNVEESLHIFQAIIGKISSWLESVHLTLFSLEQNIDQGSLGLYDLGSLETTIGQMVPTISSLSELNDMMLTSGVEEHLTRLKVTKIQSEWSSLQHYLASVKQQALSREEQTELNVDIGKLLFQIDDVSISMFDFQEKKHASANLPTSSLSEKVSNSDDVFSIGSSSDGSTLVNINPGGPKEDSGIAEIELAFNTVFEAVQTVLTKASQMRLQDLTRKRLEKLKERWEQLQAELDHFKHEHKEDRWSTVFKRVSDQVDVMIDGLDKSVVHCQSFVHQIRSWSQQQQQSSYKALLRSFQHKTNTCPIDLEKFKSIEKGFEAKSKYYTPSIDRMLTILGNGISSRGAKDTVIQQRHDTMTQRWSHMKEAINDLKSKDLIEAERLLSGGQPTKKTNGWKGIKYRTPEPALKNNTKAQTKDLPRCSPLRSSLSDSSSTSLLPKRAQTPKSGRIENQPTKNHDFYEEDERYFGIDILKPKKTAKRALLPHQLERPSTTQDIRPRAKTPSRRDLNVSPKQTSGGGYRSKSSIGDLRMDRVMSPRSATPSLIPRAKTPKNVSRTNSPLMIPHTKSTRTRNISPVSNLTQSALRKKQSMPLLRHKPSLMEISVQEDGRYHPDPKDPLDIEMAQIMNASPISIRCQRIDSGKYYFGSEQSLSSMGGKKLYTCKLMVYTDRKNGKLKNNKVLIRVGGGWQDLEFFLLEHSSLMTSDVVVRTYTGNLSELDSRQTSKGWKN